MAAHVRPLRDTGQRIVAWFSCGDASAVAAKLALDKWGTSRVVVARIRLEGEHPDNDRFAAECATWFGCEITELRSPKYASHWDVIEQRRFLNGPQGALCTAELKRAVREAFQHYDDMQVFGFTAEEAKRAQEFREHHGEVMVSTPLIEEGLSKDDCHALVASAGVELPMMYRLGYPNNNCVGCVKGGMGYWNKVRVDFPEAFDRMAKLEREIGRSCIGGGGRPRVFLDELDPKRGRLSAEPKLECGITCFKALRKLDDIA